MNLLMEKIYIDNTITDAFKNNDAAKSKDVKELITFCKQKKISLCSHRGIQQDVTNMILKYENVQRDNKTPHEILDIVENLVDFIDIEYYASAYCGELQNKIINFDRSEVEHLAYASLHNIENFCTFHTRFSSKQEELTEIVQKFKRMKDYSFKFALPSSFFKQSSLDI